MANLPGRRGVLIAALSALFVSGWAGRFASAQQPVPPHDPRTFAAFLDVLLPDDGVTPAASALGVPDGIEEIAGDVEPLRRLIALACDWLDQVADAPFHALADTDQQAIVTWMSTADYNQVPRRFYHLTRQLAVELAYADATGVAGLPLAAAPQPLGYPPPWG
jgi:hypothetical protein